MAQLPLFGLASNLLGMIIGDDSPFRKAYEWVKPILEANDDLDKLKDTIQLIQAVLLDAEKTQDGSATLAIWIQRVKDVLYEADDLFDEVATDYLLKQQQQQENQISKKVRSFFSASNPFISSDSIAKGVEAIRKKLDDISKDAAQFSSILSRCESQTSNLMRRAETGPFVDEAVVVGRGDDKKAILDILLDESVLVVAIIGIGGMGKTTLAQLIYNHEEVQKNFNTKWWCCISDIVGQTNVLKRIVESLGVGSHGDLKKLLRESVSRSGKYMLVLDDVWDNDLDIWFDIMSLLSNGAKGSKVIVTTRFLSVPMAMKKDRCSVHRLNGLSEVESWELFRKIAFTVEQENTPVWVRLGREIVKKCANVPLAIKSVASLVSTKDTLQEWESIKNQKLLSDGSILSTLRLSYDHLPSNLKHCFAYCSLYPKDSWLYERELVHLWMAQGYVKPKENETAEAAGHGYFNELFRRCFFQEAKRRYNGEIVWCKMHDLVHDLAQQVAGDESVIVTQGFTQFHKKIQHASIAYGYEISASWKVPPQLLKAERLRSCLLMLNYSYDSQLVLDQQLMNFRFLRALSTQYLNIGEIPSSVGELKYLRYLNLSGNSFQVLPDSITKLVNLLTLDLHCCGFLDALPNDFRKLINLKHLDIGECCELEHMPPGFGELTSLQRLSDFKVSKRGGDLDALGGLNLTGQLQIAFDRQSDWSEDELVLEHSHIPEAIDVLSIENYPSMVLWKGDPTPRLHKLTYLALFDCKKVKKLPPLRRLPFLRALELRHFDELEYIEDEDDAAALASSTAPFFPSLRSLELENLHKLKEWSRRRDVSLVFPLLSKLKTCRCLLLKSIPTSPHLERLYLTEVRGELVDQIVSKDSSSALQHILIYECTDLTSFPRHQGLPSLHKLHLHDCPNLSTLRIMANSLKELAVHSCPCLNVLDYCETQIKQGSMLHLRRIFLEEVPESENIPFCLGFYEVLGKLQIQRYDTRENRPSMHEYLSRCLNEDNLWW